MLVVCRLFSDRDDLDPSLVHFCNNRYYNHLQNVLSLVYSLPIVSRDSLCLMFSRDQDQDDRIMVFFTEDASIGVKPIRQFVQTMADKSVQRAIVVIRNQITPAAAKVMQSLPKIKFETFFENELLINITEHQLVPKHQLITDEEKRALLQRYHLKETQLPRIQVNDPVARYFGLKRGDVVKILRPSETAGRYVTYRLVM